MSLELIYPGIRSHLGRPHQDLFPNQIIYSGYPQQDLFNTGTIDSGSVVIITLVVVIVNHTCNEKTFLFDDG